MHNSTLNICLQSGTRSTDREVQASTTLPCTLAVQIPRMCLVSPTSALTVPWLVLCCCPSSTPCCWLFWALPQPDATMTTLHPPEVHRWRPPQPPLTLPQPPLTLPQPPPTQHQPLPLYKVVYQVLPPQLFNLSMASCR